MLRWKIFISVCLAALATGCKKSEVPSYSPSSCAAEALKLYDANKDGGLEGDELKACPSLKVAMPQIDSDGNGKLTEAELTARITSYQNQGVAAITLEALILSNGESVPNAVVTLVPEEFMKAGLKPAKGTANQNGRVFLASEGNTAGNVQLGLYRVEISLPGPGGEETLPAQWNKETALGIEVSTDVPNLERGIIVDLKRQ